MVPGLLPAIVFLVGAFVSFSTGSAWGTMSILFPLMVPLAHSLAPGDRGILLGTIASVLSGSVWGNHASPIADSCIMASLSCGADHHDHVKTQAVYAISVGGISTFVCSIPVGMGWLPVWVALVIGIALVILMVLLFGEPVTSEINWKDTTNHGLFMTWLRRYTPLPKYCNIIYDSIIVPILKGFETFKKLFRKKLKEEESEKLNSSLDEEKASTKSSSNSIKGSSSASAKNVLSPAVSHHSQHYPEHYLSMTDPYKK